MLVRPLLALVAGGLLCLAFPTFDIWVAAPLALALLALALTGARARAGFGLGLLAGLAFFVPTLQWSGVYVGDLPWLALSTLEALFLALAGLVYAWLAHAGRVRPVVFALVWVVTEGFRARAPYGGFPWLKLAFGQAGSPFGRLVALGGPPLVAFVIALSAGLLALAVQSVARRRGGMPLTRVAVATSLAVGLGAAGLLVPLPMEGPTAQFLGVQGNVPQPGLDFNSERRAVLDNHVRATVNALQDVAAGRAPHPDLIVWPENASDIDPLRNADAKAEILATVDAAQVPLILGGLLEEPPGHVSNVSLLYEPGKGNVARYVKRHPVPFAEYIPNRAFYRIFSKEVDLVRRDFVAGDQVGLFTIHPKNAPEIRAGLAICFEVAYDDIMLDAVRAGANVLVVQTNNATFGFTAESPQQLAISRVRAMEFGRSVIHVSTVGQSALITPDGTAHQVTSLFTQAVVQGALPLRTETTLATRIGEVPEWVAAGALLLVMVGSFVRGGRRTSETDATAVSVPATTGPTRATKDEDGDDES